MVDLDSFLAAPAIGASQPGLDEALSPLQTPSPIPLPSISALGTAYPPSSLTPVVCDERVIARLLELLLLRGGLTVVEAARRLQVHPNGIRQYLNGQRSKPSLKWFVNFAELCGARVMIEFPTQKRQPR